MLCRIVFWCWWEARSYISPSMYIFSGRLSQDWTQLFLSHQGSTTTRFNALRSQDSNNQRCVYIRFELTHLRCLTFCKFDLAGAKRYVVSWFIACLLLNATTESVVEARCRINRWNIFFSLPGNINSTSVNDSMESRGATYNVWAYQHLVGIRLIST